jgi:RNA polymerase sigma factor (sigma-70 family)
MALPIPKTDGELLAQFCSDHSQMAFTELVNRHGAMVHGVALRVLADHHEAQDVMQAVFLTLARKAAALRRAESVGGWLHTVAWQAAMDVQRSRRSRQRREATAVLEQSQTADATADAGLFRAELDAAVNQLPERYRQPLVLFHLEGRSLEETSRATGLNLNTVCTRLTRARELLRKKLVRRGVTIGSVGALTVLLSAESGAAVLPATLVASTIGAATSGAVSTTVAALTKGALHMLYIAKIKTVSLTAAACLVVAGAGVVVAQQITRPQPPEPRTSTVVVGPTSTTTEVATVPGSAQSPNVPANIPSLVAGQKVLVSFRHYPVAEHRDGPKGLKTVPITDAEIIEGKKRKHAEVLAALRAAGLDVLQVLSVAQGGLNQGGLVYESLILLDGKGKETEQALASVPYFFAGVVFQDGDYQRGLPMPKNQLPKGWDKQPPVPAAYAYKQWGVGNWQEREPDLQRYKTLAAVKVESVPEAGGGAGRGGSAGCVMLKPTPGHTLLEVFLVTGAGFQTCGN